MHTLVHLLTQRIIRLVSFLEQAFLHLTKPFRYSIVLSTAVDLTRGKADLIAANALLRQQLIVLHRQVNKPSFTQSDRLWLVLLASRVKNWKESLLIFKPDTLLCWHRQGFRLFWKFKSRHRGGRPKLDAETVALIQQMAQENRLWGAERIRGELLNSALFALSQGDSSDALFYLNRAKPIAFGPALQRFDPIVDLIKKDQLNQALTDLDRLNKEWPIGDEKKGAKIFGDACAGCHGSDGQGGVGRKLKPNQFVQTSTNAELLQLLLTGRTGTAMRGFNGRLSESQLADAIAFLRSWQK